jgi:hypothetical protein
VGAVLRNQVKFLFFNFEYVQVPSPKSIGLLFICPINYIKCYKKSRDLGIMV